MQGAAKLESMTKQTTMAYDIELPRWSRLMQLGAQTYVGLHPAHLLGCA